MSQSLLFFRAFQQPVGGGWQVCYCQRLWSQSLLFFRAFQLCKIHYDKVEECVAIPSFIQGISTLIGRLTKDPEVNMSQSLLLFRAFQQPIYHYINME